MAKHQKDTTEELAQPAVTETALAESHDYGDDAGVGHEGAHNVQIPFVSVLQQKSPQVENEDPPGAKKGMLFNNVTKELIPANVEEKQPGLCVIPVYKTRQFVEYVPREKGGGFVAVHEADSAEVVDAINDHKARTGLRFPNKKNPLTTGENELVETYSLYCITLAPDAKTAVGIAVMAFTSSKIKAFRQWESAMTYLKVVTPRGPKTPPLFANRMRIQTTHAQDKKTGEKFEAIKLSPLDPTKGYKDCLLSPTDPLYTGAKALYEQITHGEKKADFSKQAGPATDDAGEAGEEEPAF